MRIYLKKADYLVILSSLVLIFFSFYLIHNKSSPQISLIIETPTEKFVYPLNTDKTISVKGNIGLSEIEIKNKTARFVHSPCKNHTCILCKPINQNNEWNACLPNGIIIRITGDTNTKEEFDAIGF